MESPSFAADEARVVANWSGIVRQRLQSEKASLHDGARPRLGLVYSGVAEDVYYSSLLVTALAARNLTVVSVPMAEYAWYTVRPSRALRASAVFHRLTTWTQLNTSGLVAPGEASPMQAERLGPTGLLSQWWREQSKPPLSRCQTFARRFRVFRHERTRMRGRYSCGHWRVCEP